MAEETKNTETKKEDEKKKGFFSESRIEMFVAIFLGITALLMAWGTWIGSLHGGNQATNYTKSNNVSADGNSIYNEKFQQYLADLMAWNTYMEYCYDLEIAQAKGDEVSAQLINEKLSQYMDQNFSPELIEAYNNMTDDMYSPFSQEFIDSYFTDALDKLDESQALLEQGMEDNKNGDRYGLVTVIYSVVLFMLGIIGVFKKLPNRKVVLIIAVIGLVLTSVYMFTIPMPTDFSLFGYFGA